MPKNNFRIPIFKAEREAGLAKQIQANASIAYVTRLQDTKLSQEVAQDFLRSISSEYDDDQFDLFYLSTILVSTGQNLNLDVFAKEPTWAARYTPIHKQFNLEHDQSKIIGHMTSAKAVNASFEPISDDTSIDELPDKFHILTGAVIYRALADEEAQEGIDKIIEEIGKGEWYVSMECLFRGFDYAVTSATGEQRIIPRNEETAWLTKHLRQYGGTGVYNDYVLGRVLKNITFSGKGLVRKPANPESIIFNENVKSFNGVIASLGYITTTSDSNTEIEERVSMANENEAQVKALEKQLEESRSEIKTLTDEIKKHESSATTAKITALEADVQAKAERITQLEGELKNSNDAKAEFDKNLKAAEDRADKAEKEVADIKAAEQTRSRVEKLTKLFAPEDEAKQIVSMFTDKTEEQFDVLVNLFSSKWKKPEDTSTASKEPEVNQNALEDAEPEPDASLATQDNKDVENTRAAMAAVFAGFLNSDPITIKNDD